ncbi:MAG TPA: FAD-binding oxidoreductase [Arenicellales bacterium]|nr:FAD-binding oxidoreductase [Arenicellales bacterium]
MTRATGDESCFSDDFRGDPYWWDDAPPPDLGQPPLPADADVVVIGAGYTGLHAALQTARGGRGTVVLDAGHAGWGCSTRNGGQVSTSIKPDYEALAARHGARRAFDILREGRNALDWIRQFVDSEGIDCDYTVPGRFHAAHGPRHFERLARGVDREISGLETGARIVPRAEQRRELGTDAYHGGVVFPHHASLHPARYHRGLLDRVIQAGAAVISHCPAQSVEKQAAGVRVLTPRGVINAANVVVASNGYTGPVTPWHRRRVVPIGSYVIATEPLDPALMDRLMPTDRVVSDTRRVVYYYRPSPDRTRILFGGRVSARETDPRRSGPRLLADLVRLFPDLAGTRISHSWVGFVAYTFDTLAHVGRHDGVHYAMGYCGSGVSMASYLGMRIGQQVLGLDEGRTAFDDLPFPTRPLYSGKPWFLGAMVNAYRLRDRILR